MRKMSKYINPLDNSISQRKIVLIMAWPVIVEQILQTMVNYIDTAMVGSLGVDATAAVSINTTLIWLINGIIMGISTGFSVPIAQAIGEGNAEKAKAILRQAMLGMLVFGLGMSAILEIALVPIYARIMGAEEAIIGPAQHYLSIIGASIVFEVFLAVSSAIVRGMGNTKTPMLYNILLNCINVLMNFIFIYPTRMVDILGHSMKIYGFGMGVEGAAIGTLIATVVSGMLMLSVLFSKKNTVHISIKDKYRFNRNIMRTAVIIGIPIVFERISISSGQILTTAFATSLGTAALAAHQLANTAESICYMPATGFGVAITTLVAQSIGADRPELAKKYSNLCLKYNIIIMCVMATLMFAFAPKLMGIFIDDVAVITAGAALLRIQAFAEPCLAVNYVFTGVMKGTGDTRWPFYISIIGMWLVRIPLAFILIKVLNYGLTAMWVAMAIDWYVRTIVCFVRMKKVNM